MGNAGRRSTISEVESQVPVDGPKAATSLLSGTGVLFTGRLVVAAMGIMRLLAIQPWDAELIPIALSAMVLAIAYNPHFALMVTFGLALNSQ